MSRIKAIFWNTEQRRIRAGWRLVIQFVLFAAILIGLALIGRLLGTGDAMVLIFSALYLLLGLGLAWLMARFIDRRPLADFGFHCRRAWWLDLGFGFVLGAVLMTGIFFTESTAGWVDVISADWRGSGLSLAHIFIVSLVVYVAIGFNEELTFRGCQLRNLAEGLASRWLGPRLAVAVAMLLSSGIFGIGHALNPHATMVSTVNIVLAGLFLSLPYVLTGELGLSIGLHTSWNLFQGTVYGFPVSGAAPGRHVLVLKQNGPQLWTGGEFGPEAGLLAVASILVGCGLTILWVRARHKHLGLHVALAQYQGRRETF
jgi:membrane protease YdiL (CAAX protease family)